jgi:hypothetical protein
MKVVKMYMEYIVFDCNNLDDYLHYISSWNYIKYEVNSCIISRILENDTFKKDGVSIPCYCNKDQPHSFYTNKNYCELGNLVYQTISSEFMNGVHNITLGAINKEMIYKHSYARPPFRMTKDYKIIPDCLHQTYDDPKSFIVELRDYSSVPIYSNDIYSDLTPPIWLGPNPNTLEPEKSTEEPVTKKQRI